MKSKIKDTQILLRLVIISLCLVALYIIVPFAYHEMSLKLLLYCSGLLLLFVFNLIRLFRLKEISILNKGLQIRIPFLFKSMNFNFEEIESIEKKVLKGDSGNGPGYIDFPDFQLSIFFKNKKRIRLSTKENVGIQKIAEELENKIAL